MFPNMKSTAEIIKETREAAILECINLCKMRKTSFCYDNVVSDMEKLVAPAKPQEDLSIYYDPMDPGFPDRGSAAAVRNYLLKRKEKGLLNPTAAAARIQQLEQQLANR